MFLGVGGGGDTSDRVSSVCSNHVTISTAS
jgi:hypothetical protein